MSKKCVKGFPCSSTCISRSKLCWANLSNETGKVAESFEQFVNRIVGIGNETESTIKNEDPVDTPIDIDVEDIDLDLLQDLERGAKFDDEDDELVDKEGSKNAFEKNEVTDIDSVTNKIREIKSKGEENLTLEDREEIVQLNKQLDDLGGSSLELEALMTQEELNKELAEMGAEKTRVNIARGLDPELTVGQNIDKNQLNEEEKDIVKAKTASNVDSGLFDLEGVFANDRFILLSTTDREDENIAREIEANLDNSGTWDVSISAYGLESDDFDLEFSDEKNIAKTISLLNSLAAGFPENKVLNIDTEFIESGIDIDELIPYFTKEGWELNGEYLTKKGG